VNTDRYPCEASIAVDYAGMADTPEKAAELLRAWLLDGGVTEAHIQVTMDDGTTVTVAPAGAGGRA